MNKSLNIYCIYNAKGSFFGEVKYLKDKYLHGVNCSMCEITHNAFSPKSYWKEKLKSFQFNIHTLHLDEQNEYLKDFTKGLLPCVVGENEMKLKLLLSTNELNEFCGNVDLFFNKLNLKIRTDYSFLF